MPPKKKNQNQQKGQYWFMKDMQEQLRLQGKNVSMDKMAPIACPKWKELTLEEKKVWEERAKLERVKMKDDPGVFRATAPGAARPDSERLDNTGNIISERENVAAIEAQEKLRDRHLVSAMLHTLDLEEVRKQKLYLVSVEHLCQTEEGQFLPAEIALLEYSMDQGIGKLYHDFLDPGEIPMGYRFNCQERSNDRNQIPIQKFELTNSDFYSVYIRLKSILNPTGESGQFPYLYTRCAEMACVRYTLDMIFERSFSLKYERNPFDKKLLRMECLLQELCKHPDLDSQKSIKMSETDATSMLVSPTYDFEPEVACDYHEKLECRHCALAAAKKYSFALSEFLNDKYHFDILKNHHLPNVKAEMAQTVVKKGFGTSRPRRGRGATADPMFGGSDVRYRPAVDDDDASSVASFSSVSTVRSHSTLYSQNVMDASDIFDQHPARAAAPTPPSDPWAQRSRAAQPGPQPALVVAPGPHPARARAPGPWSQPAQPAQPARQEAPQRAMVPGAWSTREKTPAFSAPGALPEAHTESYGRAAKPDLRSDPGAVLCMSDQGSSANTTTNDLRNIPPTNPGGGYGRGLATEASARPNTTPAWLPPQQDRDLGDSRGDAGDGRGSMTSVPSKPVTWVSAALPPPERDFDDDASSVISGVSGYSNISSVSSAGRGRGMLSRVMPGDGTGPRPAGGVPSPLKPGGRGRGLWLASKPPPVRPPPGLSGAADDVDSIIADAPSLSGLSLRSDR